MKLAAILLARIVIGEAGFDATRDDVAAHHAVIASRAERMRVRYTTAAGLYSPRHTGVAKSLRPWIAQLDRSGDRPEAWPSSASWTVHRPKWERVLELAGKAVGGELPHQCDGQPHHWGSPTHPNDQSRIKRGIRRGFWRVIECPGTKNTFLTTD